MKKILIMLMLILTSILNINLSAKADVMPYYINNIHNNSIGVYQATNNIKIYKEPNELSPLMLDVFWDSEIFSSPEISASNLFIVFIQKKQLAYLAVTDENENWVEVVFFKNGVKKGWVKKEDENRFECWRTFYNLYGRKYGLYYMKDAPESTKSIYGSNSDDAQKIDVINHPQTLKMTVVKGNWVLVNVFDMDKLVKIGWLKWRNTRGEIYLFPAIK